jgi:hypothetical protein
MKGRTEKVVKLGKIVIELSLPLDNKTGKRNIRCDCTGTFITPVIGS